MRSGLFALALVIALVNPVAALEVRGVRLEDSATLVDGTRLVLNGAGVRVKFIFDVYVGALYLPAPSRQAETLLATPTANRVSMHFVYSRVAKHKIDEGWREGFEANLDAASRGAVAARLERFVDLFPDLVEGDRVWIDFVPGLGTRVSINGESRGVIEGDDFNAALLTIWLGREPVSEALKNAMLGVDTP